MSSLSNLDTRFEAFFSSFFTKFILYAIDGFLIAGAGLLAPIFAVFVEKIGGSLIEVGVAFSIFSFTAGIGIFVISRLEDVNKKNIKKFVVSGYFLAMIGYTLYLFANSVAFLYVSQFILGIAAAVRVPSYDVLITKSSPNHLAVAWGNWNAVAYIVAGSTATIGATIAAIYGFDALILLMSTLSAVAFLLSLLLMKSVKTPEDEVSNPF